MGVRHPEESPKAAQPSDDLALQPRHPEPAAAEVGEGTMQKADSPPCQQLQKPASIPGHPVQIAQNECPTQSMVPVGQSLGRKMDASYIQELRGAIDAKEAKLRALAAQLQELSRLQQGPQ